MNVTDTLLRPLLATAPAKPLITHYDDAAQTRVELSTATVANWAAKTANWLQEEFDVVPGDRVSVRLPAHWQTAGVLLGAWWCGAHVVEEAEGAVVAFVAPDAPSGGAESTAVVALDPLGRGLPEPPAGGAFDYLSEARVAADDFTPLAPVSDESPALLQATAAELLAAARARAADLGIGPTDRLLSTMDWTLAGGVVDALLAPLAVGASLVQITASDPAKLDARRAAERTTRDIPA